MTKKRPINICQMEYTNDYVGVDKDTGRSVGINMFDALKREGHNGKLVRFAPPADGSFQSGHHEPQNSLYWQIGCLGVTTACSAECESSFVQCADCSASSPAKKRVDAFAKCIEEQRFTSLKGCTADCSPTLTMLQCSQTPARLELPYGKFGKAIDGDKRGQRPKDSRCEM